MTNQLVPSLYIFTALECEAKALIIYFDLKKDISSKAFSIYKNSDIILTVTGVGKVAMAGGVTHTLALFPTRELPIMLNIGIAGHKTQKIGTLYSAVKVTDTDSGKTFYPQMVNHKWAELGEIKTLSKPCEQYSLEFLNDMEAAAFYEMAVKYSSSELIHCLKVISDNEESSIKEINAKIVVQWISEQVDGIETVLVDLRKRRSTFHQVASDIFEQLIKQWHFTVSGKVKLKSLLMRWELLSTENWLQENPQEFISGKSILTKLESDIDALDIHL